VCNFVPGECVALIEADRSEIVNALGTWQLPGRVDIFPLLPEATDEYNKISTEPFRRWHIVHLVDIPEGLEVLGVSKLSAALSHFLYNHKGVVELNLYQPLAALQALRRQPELTGAKSEVPGDLEPHQRGVRSSSACTESTGDPSACLS
jgi:hypothetical protein